MGTIDTDAGVAVAFREVTLRGKQSFQDPERWLKFFVPLKKSPEPIKKRWIYCLYFAASERATLWGECAANENGHLSVNVNLNELQRIAPEKRRGAVATNTPVVQLPRQVNGRNYYWSFVVSQIPLGPKAIRLLCRTTLTTAKGAGSYAQTFVGGTAIPLAIVDLSADRFRHKGSAQYVDVVDLESTGYRLSAEMQKAGKALIEASTPLPEMPRGKMLAVKDKLVRLAIARVIVSLSDSQPDLKKHLQHANAAADELIAFEKELRILRDAHDVATAVLISFLHSTYSILIESWYREREKQVYDQYLVYFEAVTHGLDASAEGRGYFSKYPEHIDRLCSRYIFPTTPTTDKDTFLLARKHYLVVLHLWTKFLPAQALTAPLKVNRDSLDKRTAESVDRLNALLGKQAFKFEKGKLVAAGEGSARLTHENVKSTASAAEAAKYNIIIADRAAVLNEIDTFEMIQKRTFETTPVLLSQIVFHAAEYMNYYFTLTGYLDNTKKTWVDHARFATAAHGALKTFVFEQMALSKDAARQVWGKNLAKYGGGLAGLIDSGLGFRDAYALANEGDTDAAVVSAASSAVAVAQTAMTYFAVVNPPLALALVGLSLGISYLLTRVKESPIQAFVLHSCFGKEFGKDGAPAWAEGGFGSWTEAHVGLERQVRSLYGLIMTFSVKTYNSAGITVTLGFYEPGTELVVEYYDNLLGPGNTPLVATVSLDSGQCVFDPNKNLARRWSCTIRRGVNNQAVEARIEFDKDYRREGVTDSACRVFLRMPGSEAGMPERYVPLRKQKIRAEDAWFGQWKEAIKEEGRGMVYLIQGRDSSKRSVHFNLEAWSSDRS